MTELGNRFYGSKRATIINCTSTQDSDKSKTTYVKMRTVNHCIATRNLFLCKQLYFVAYL